MHDLALLRLMADHNHWMNQSLYGTVAALEDAARKHDRGAFFRSIHGTLNHILLADRIWLGRLTAVPFAFQSLDQELYADFAELRQAREATDAELRALVGGLAPAALAEPVVYWSGVKKAEMAMPRGLILLHLALHQTHHRGQITTVLHQMGVDVGITDLPFMPGAATAYFGQPQP